MKSSQRGMTLIEVLVVVVIFAILIVSYLTFFNQALVFTRKTDDRRFAVQRALSMMEEVRAFVESGAENQIDLLDDFDDGKKFNPFLTLEKDLKSPTDALSGNVRVGEGWKYYRQVKVEKLPDSGGKDLRQVTVRVFQSTDGQPGGTNRADLSGIFRTLASPMPPTQVMDVYILAIENIPGWWVNMATIRPLVEASFADLEAANPGLRFRYHWITRLSYGRNRQYKPWVNAAKTASESPDSIERVYFYPGKINNEGFFYYSGDTMQAQVQVDHETLNIDGRRLDEDLVSYALADQYNAAMRAPDEARIFEKRHKAGLDREPSLRLLYDQLNENPERFKNALVINLHGELLPLPPIRNYSDPAKSPLDHPNVRVVTHAENLRVDAFRPVKLRVYPYVTEPSRFNAGAVLDDGVSILIKGARDLGTIRVQKVDAKKGYQLVDLETLKVAKRVNEGVLINLEDVPLRHGLSESQRLYGMEYVPCPVEAENNFSRNLVSAGGGPKNTARYIITIPPSALPNQPVLTVETRIGTNNMTTGTQSKDPENLSRTYVWINSEPPFSERYQFMGDPRHLPYADVKAAGGYNWYFREVASKSGYEGFDNTQNGWTEEAVDLDVPRFNLMVREALLRSHAVFTTMTGFSFYYVGVGGEIGSDRPNGFPEGLPIAGKVYGSKGVRMVKAITDGVENIRESGQNWYAIPWLGELYPDSSYRLWARMGNLPAGEFIRAPWSEMPGSGKLFDRRRRTNVQGAASFFNAVGTKSGPFNHIFSKNNDAVISDEGRELGRIFNFAIEKKLGAIRPFTLDFGSNFPPEWNFTQQTRTHARLLNTFYAATEPKTAVSSALLHLTSPDSTDSGFFVINGLSPAGETGTAYIGRYAVLTLLQGFLTAGAQPIRNHRIAQLPLIRITTPKESQDIYGDDKVKIQWEVNWRRWDGQPYTHDYPENFSEKNPLFFAIKYSADDGRSWAFADDNSPAELGEVPPENHRSRELSFDFDLSGRKGNYLLRVETFREDVTQHYAFHQVGINIKQ